MNRREFLKSAIFASVGLALLKTTNLIADKTKKIIDKVTTRKYKNLDVSLLGFGCMRLPLKDPATIDMDTMKQMVDYAINHGVNYFDTAWFYHGGKSELAIGEVLKKYPRKSFYLADKLPLRVLQDSKDVQDKFNEQLKKCQVDYFDFYLAHNVNKREVDTLERCNVYPQLLKKKQEGKIKYLGFSFHDKPELLEQVIKKYKWDFVQLQINPIDWKSVDAKQQYEIATKYNLPVIVMNPLKGGQLSTLNPKAVDLLKVANPNVSPSSWNLRYVASLPNVLVVLSGMSAYEHVVDNVKTFTNFEPLTNKEQDVLSNAIAVYNSSGAIACTYCQYCIDCPIGVDIPKHFMIYNQYKVNGNKNKFIREYENIAEDKRADKCISCGLCKTKCPQKLEIPELLKEVNKTYTSLKA